MQQTPSYSVKDVEESQISRLTLIVEKRQTKTRFICVVGKEHKKEWYIEHYTRKGTNQNRIDLCILGN